MNRFLVIFMVLLFTFAGAYGEASGGTVELDDGSVLSYDTDESGNANLTINNADGTSSGSYYDSETGSYTEWEMDEQGNTYSKTTNSDGTQTGYSSIAGGAFSDWTTDSEGNMIYNTYNTDGSSSGFYLPTDGGDYTEWNVDAKGNTSGTVYNSATGETNTFYDPAQKSNSNSGKTSNNNSSNRTNRSSSNSTTSANYYPAVSTASGPAYIYSTMGPVNVYSYPAVDGAVIARLESGTPVNVISSVSGWSEIAFGNMTGHVDSRYISFTAPAASAAAATPVPTTVPAAVPNAQYTPSGRTATEQYVTMIKIQPVTVSIHVPQAGGVVVLRWAPSETEPAMSNLTEGYKLTALSLNTEWVQVYDPITFNVGFVPRAFVNGL